MPYIINKPLKPWRALSRIAVGAIVLSIALPASGILTWYQVVNYLLLSVYSALCFIMPFCCHKRFGYKTIDCLMLLYGVFIALHYFVFVQSYVEISLIESEYIVLLYFCIRNMGVSALFLETCCIYALFGVFIVEIMYILFHGQYVYGNSMSLSLTGTFFNSSSLAMLVTVVLVLALQILLHHFMGRCMVQRRYLPLLVCIVALAVAILVITFSRTAVIALCVGCVAIFRDRISRKMMIVCVTSVLLLVCVLYFIRTASSNSRLLYYWCALCSFLDNPMLGVGIGKFMSSLTHYQSMYFVNNPSSALINDVDVTFYAYNEFLKILARAGSIRILHVSFLQ